MKEETVFKKEINWYQKFPQGIQPYKWFLISTEKKKEGKDEQRDVNYFDQENKSIEAGKISEAWKIYIRETRHAGNLPSGCSAKNFEEFFKEESKDLKL